MLKGHYLDEFTIYNTIEGDDNGEEISKSQNTSRPHFWSVLRYIDLEKTFSFAYCDEFEHESYRPNPAHDAKMAHILVALLVFVG